MATINSVRSTYCLERPHCDQGTEPVCDGRCSRKRRYKEYRIASEQTSRGFAPQGARSLIVITSSAGARPAAVSPGSIKPSFHTGSGSPDGQLH